MVTTLISLSSIGKVDDRAKDLSHNDLGALKALVTVSEHFMANGYRVVKHLYVQDGDLKAEDRTAKEIAGFEAEARASVAKLRPLLRTDAAKAKAAEFDAQLSAFESATNKAIRQSRQETVDKVEERTGSRTTYEQDVMPVFERLDVLHNQLEELVSETAVADVRQASATTASAKRDALLIMLAAVAAAIGLALVVTRSVVRPVAELGDRLRSLNDHCLQGLGDGLNAVAEGDLTHAVAPVTTPVEVRSSDELGRLTETFNSMLAKTQGGLESYNAMREQLGMRIGEVSAGAGTVSAASEQMATTSDEAGRAVGEIASSASELARTAEQLDQLVRRFKIAA